MAARKRSGCGVAVLCLALAAAGTGAWLWQRVSAGGAGIAVTITPEQLQMGLEKAFPVEKKELFLTVSLSDPIVALDPRDNDRIGFGATVSLKAAGRKLANGTVTAAGKLRYDASTGTFYLETPEIRKLDIDRVSDRDAGAVRKATTYILQKAIGHVPVYQLDTGDPVQKLAKRGIRSVRVTNGAVEVRLGLNP